MERRNMEAPSHENFPILQFIILLNIFRSRFLRFRDAAEIQRSHQKPDSYKKVFSGSFNQIGEF